MEELLLILKEEFVMNKGGFSLGWYLFALGMGVASGGLFVQGAYSKGKADAYSDCADRLQKIRKEVEATYLNKEES